MFHTKTRRHEEDGGASRGERRGGALDARRSTLDARLLLLALCCGLAGGLYGQTTRGVTVDGNGTVTRPAGFWGANAAGIAGGLAGTFQSPNARLSSLASSNATSGIPSYGANNTIVRLGYLGITTYQGNLVSLTVQDTSNPANTALYYSSGGGGWGVTAPSGLLAAIGGVNSTAAAAAAPVQGVAGRTGNVTIQWGDIGGVPAANSTASGVVTTGAQTLAGDKTLTGHVTLTGQPSAPSATTVMTRDLTRGDALTGPFLGTSAALANFQRTVANMTFTNGTGTALFVRDSTQSPNQSDFPGLWGRETITFNTASQSRTVFWWVGGANSSLDFMPTVGWWRARVMMPGSYSSASEYTSVRAYGGSGTRDQDGVFRSAGSDTSGFGGFTITASGNLTVTEGQLAEIGNCTATVGGNTTGSTVHLRLFTTFPNVGSPITIAGNSTGLTVAATAYNETTEASLNRCYLFTYRYDATANRNFGYWVLIRSTSSGPVQGQITHSTFYSP